MAGEGTWKKVILCSLCYSSVNQSEIEWAVATARRYESVRLSVSVFQFTASGVEGEAVN